MTGIETSEERYTTGIVQQTPARSRAVVSALTACVALLAFVVFRIVGFMERHDTGHHGIVLGLPLLCIGCGMMVSMAWMEANGRAVGPWRLIIALAFLLGTIVVAVLS